jgi:hypothetical protein
MHYFCVDYLPLAWLPKRLQEKPTWDFPKRSELILLRLWNMKGIFRAPEENFGSVGDFPQSPSLLFAALQLDFGARTCISGLPARLLNCIDSGMN